jgi:hypothetical protein
LAERSIVSEKKGIVCLGEARIVFVEALCLKKVALDDLVLCGYCRYLSKIHGVWSTTFKIIFWAVLLGLVVTVILLVLAFKYDTF